MKRLTWHNGEYWTQAQNVDVGYKDICARLAAYEDHDRTPEEVAELVKRDTGMVPYKESLADRNCPKCFAGISWDALNDPMDYAPKFCTECGQRFDWSEDEVELLRRCK